MAVKDVAQIIYSGAAGATLIITALRYIERKNKLLEDVPKIKKALKLVLKELSINFDWDDDDD